MSSQDSNLVDMNEINSFFDMALLQQLTPSTDIQYMIISFFVLFKEDFLKLSVTYDGQIAHTKNTVCSDDISDLLRYDNMVTLVKEHVIKISMPELEVKLLQHLLPSMRTLTLKILKDMNEIVDNIMEENKAIQLENLRRCLHLCLNVIDLVHDLISYILKNKWLELIQIRSLPVNVAIILSSVFLHCKEKKDLYVNIGETNDVILLFKKAQDINLKLLELLKVNVTIQITSKTESSVLEEVLYVIGGIGELLLDINLKACADNWIGYLNVLQKYQTHLSGNFNNSRGLNFFTKEILKNVHKLSVEDGKDLKSKKQIQKVVQLLTKLLYKFVEIFKLQTINKKIVIFMIKLFNYYKPSNRITNEIVDLSEEFRLLSSLINGDGICEELLSDNLKEEYGFLIVLIICFRCICNNVQKRPHINIMKYLDVTFQCYENYTLETFYNNHLRIYELPIYEELTTNIATIIHLYGSSKQCGDDIANYLFQKLTGDSFCPSLLALDVWLLVLRLGSISLRFDTLCGIVKKNDSFLKSNNSTLPKLIILKVFLKRLYQMLDDDYKMHAVETYPINVNLYLWRTIGLCGFPKSAMHMINDLSKQCIGCMKKFLNEDIDNFTFINMCQMWETLSTVEIININVKELYTPLIKLWEIHNWNEDVQCYSFYNYYMSCLFTVTNRFITSMCNYQIITVLKQITRILEIDRSNLFLQEHALRTLNVLCNKAYSPQNIQDLLNLISDILNKLLNVNDMIIKQRSLELLYKYMTLSPHQEIVHKAAYSLDLQMMLANFHEKKTIIDSDLMINYLRYVNGNVYVHKCNDVCKTMPKTKRIKLNESICTILDRIERDVNNLKSFDTYLTRDDMIKINVIKNIFDNI